MPRTGKTRDGWLNPSFSLGYDALELLRQRGHGGLHLLERRLLRKSPENGKAISVLPPVEIWKDERAQRDVHIRRHEAGYRPVVCWQNAEDEK